MLSSNSLASSQHGCNTNNYYTHTPNLYTTTNDSNRRRIQLPYRKHLSDLSCFRLLIFHQPKMIVSVFSSAVPPPAPPSSGSFPHASWKAWVVGVIISILLPSFGNKLWSLQSLKDRVDSVVETVELITDIVEDVAEQVEKVADDIGNRLPEGQLRDALELLEDVADKTEKAAELAGDVIDRVQEVGEEVESLLQSSVHVQQTITITAVDSAQSSHTQKPN